MDLEDLANPVVASRLAAFGPGAAGTAAHLNYGVPLPGSYSWDRVVELDIPRGVFDPALKQAGTSFQQLGVSKMKDEKNLDSLDRDGLEWFYRRVLPAAARPSLRLVAEVDGTVDPLLEQLKSRLDRALSDGARAELVERRRIIAEPDDVGLERIRVNSFIKGLADVEAQVQPIQGTARVIVPTQGVGNSVRMVPVDVPKEAEPRVALVETWELRSVLGDYGLGRTLQTFSLLPGEHTTVTVQTWRSEATTREDATSIFDSSDVAAQTRFTSAVTSATGAAFQDQGGWTASVATSVKAGTGMGIVSGQVAHEGRFTASHQEASRRWSEAMSAASSEHAAQVNNSRRQAVQASSSNTAESGTAVTTVRRLANKNRRRVVNYVFRELNQTYVTYAVLKDIKVASYNGNPGSAEVVPLADLGKLIEKYILDENDNRKAVARMVLSLCAKRIDADGEVCTTLEVAGDANGIAYNWLPATLNDQGEIEVGDDLLGPNVRWRFTPGPLSADHIDGVVMNRSSVVLRTDNIVVEALLGQADAADPYEAARQALDLLDHQARIALLEAEAAKTARRAHDADAVAPPAPAPVPAGDGASDLG